MGAQAKDYMKAAQRCADWFVTNQIINDASGDNGRYTSEIKTTDFSRPIGPSIAWTTGMSLQALLMMHQRTKDKKYLESAIQAGEYIKSLQ